MLQLKSPVEKARAYFSNIKQFIKEYDYKKLLHPRVFSLAILVLVLPITILAAKTQQDLTQRAAPTQVAQLTDITNKVNADIKAYVANSQSEAVENTLIADVVVRKQKLSDLIPINPQEAIRISKAFLKNPNLSRLPDVVKNNLEKDTSVEGEYSSFLADNFKNKTTKTIQFITTQEGKGYGVYGNTKNLQSGAKYSFQGIVSNQKIATYASKALTAPPILTPPTKQRVAIVLVNLNNTSTIPLTPQENVYQRFVTDTDSVSSFIEDTSYGRISFPKENVKVFNWTTLNLNADCTSGNYLGDWKTAAEQKNHISEDDYDHIIFFIAGANCPFQGLAILGDYKHAAKHVLIMLDDINKDRAKWIYTAEHELGHNFGMMHASTYDCTNAGLKGVVTLAAPRYCQPHEYFDPLDVMGAVYDTSISHTYSTFHKYEAGWIEDKHIQTIATEGGTAYLSPAEDGVGTLLLLVPIPVKTRGENRKYYAVEFRQPTHVDKFFGGEVFKGVLIRIVGNANSGNNAEILKAHPEKNWPEAFAFLQGDSLYDYDSGLHINVTKVALNLSEPYAQVEVKYDDKKIAFDCVKGGISCPTPTVIPSCNDLHGKCSLARIACTDGVSYPGNFTGCGYYSSCCVPLSPAPQEKAFKSQAPVNCSSKVGSKFKQKDYCMAKKDCIKFFKNDLENDHRSDPLECSSTTDCPSNEVCAF